MLSGSVKDTESKEEKKEEKVTTVSLSTVPFKFFKKDSVASKFHQHIVRGEEEQAQEMLKNNPALLLETSQVTDYSGRVIRGTALQMALGADDHNMWKMMLPYFDQLPSGKAAALEQYNAQFIESKDPLLEKPYNFQPIIDALIKDTNVEIVLQKFEEDFKPQGIITHGKHSNIQAVIDALRAYQRMIFMTPKDEKKHEKNLATFWCRVIGHLQSLLPACYAQAYCYGMENSARGYHSRSLKLANKNVDLSYFPYPLVNSDPRFRIGRDFAVACPFVYTLTRGGGCASSLQTSYSFIGDARDLETLFKYKTKARNKLVERLQTALMPKSSKPKRCSVM